MCHSSEKTQLRPAAAPHEDCLPFIDTRSTERNQPTLPQLCPQVHKLHCLVSFLVPAAYFPCSLHPRTDILVQSHSSSSLAELLHLQSRRLAVHVRSLELGEIFSSFLYTEFYSYPINLPGFETGSLVPCFGRVTLSANCLYLKIIQDNFVLYQKLARCIL